MNKRRRRSNCIDNYVKREKIKGRQIGSRTYTEQPKCVTALTKTAGRNAYFKSHHRRGTYRRRYRFTDYDCPLFESYSDAAMKSPCCGYRTTEFVIRSRLRKIDSGVLVCILSKSQRDSVFCCPKDDRHVNIKRRHQISRLQHVNQ